MVWYENGDIDPLLSVEEGRVVVLDLETTGLRPGEDEILEIALINGEGGVLLHSLVRPIRANKWDAASSVHSITPSDVEAAPTIGALSSRIGGIIEGADILVGYNLPFDLAFLRAADVKAFPRFQFDVMREFAPVTGRRTRGGGYAWVSLQRCASHYGLRFRAHNALDDARATLYCFEKMLRGGDEEKGVTYLQVCRRATGR